MCCSVLSYKTCESKRNSVLRDTRSVESNEAIWLVEQLETKLILMLDDARKQELERYSENYRIVKL